MQVKIGQIGELKLVVKKITAVFNRKKVPKKCHFLKVPLLYRTLRPLSIERSKSTISKAHKHHFNLFLEIDTNVIEDRMPCSNSGI